MIAASEAGYMIAVLSEAHARNMGRDVTEQDRDTVRRVIKVLTLDKVRRAFVRDLAWALAWGAGIGLALALDKFWPLCIAWFWLWHQCKDEIKTAVATVRGKAQGP